MRYILLFLAVFTAIGVMTAEVPCVVTQVDSSLFPSGARISVLAVSSRTANCPENPAVEFRNGAVFATHDSLRYTVDRLDPSTGQWERIGEQHVGRVVSGSNQRTELFMLSPVDGRYRLTSVNGNVFLEAIHFTVGGTGENALTVLMSPRSEPQLHMPYLRSARVTSGGYLYFRGYLGNSSVFASGYLYQVRDGKVEILPVDFEEVSTETENVFVSRQWLRGGSLDLQWVRVKLSNNNFDPTRPVYASVTRDGGGITIQGVVFDPTDPAATYTGGFGGEYRTTSR